MEGVSSLCAQKPCRNAILDRKDCKAQTNITLPQATYVTPENFSCVGLWCLAHAFRWFTRPSVLFNVPCYSTTFFSIKCVVFSFRIIGLVDVFIDGWKTLFLWTRPIFKGQTVSSMECNHLKHKKHGLTWINPRYFMMLLHLHLLSLLRGFRSFHFWTFQKNCLPFQCCPSIPTASAKGPILSWFRSRCSKVGGFLFRAFRVSHSIHGIGIFTYIYHKSQPNVGKYAMHGWYRFVVVGFGFRMRMFFFLGGGGYVFFIFINYSSKN